MYLRAIVGALGLALIGACAAPSPEKSEAGVSIPIQEVSPVAAWKTKNDMFMQEIAKAPKVACTSSGLCYEMKEAGQGRSPTDQDVVTIEYTQTLIDGSPVESSAEHGAPAHFQAGKAIVGFSEALALMRPGAKARFYVPASLAFQDRGAGTKIPPWSALIIDVELLRVD